MQLPHFSPAVGIAIAMFVCFHSNHLNSDYGPPQNLVFYDIDLIFLSSYISNLISVKICIIETQIYENIHKAVPRPGKISVHLEKCKF